MLQHIDEFIADQHSADDLTHLLLLDRDHAQPTRFSSINSDFPRQIQLSSLHQNCQALNFREKSFSKAWILLESGVVPGGAWV